MTLFMAIIIWSRPVTPQEQKFGGKEKICYKSQNDHFYPRKKKKDGKSTMHTTSPLHISSPLRYSTIDKKQILTCLSQ